jgi:hypothetical protein
MELEVIRKVLAWCTLINWGVLMLWVFFVVFAGDWMYATHGRLFKLSREAFNTVNYAAMALFKLLVLVFNFVPYLVLRLLF